MTEKRKPQVGDRGWVCVPDIEAEGYGDKSPRCPWKVQVTQVLAGNLKCQAYSEETGKVDDDSNATALVYESDFFYEERDADKAFLKKSLWHLKDNLQRLALTVESLSHYIGSME